MKLQYRNNIKGSSIYLVLYTKKFNFHSLYTLHIENLNFLKKYIYIKLSKNFTL